MKPEIPILTILSLAAGLLFLSPVLYSVWMSFQTADAFYAGHVTLRWTITSAPSRSSISPVT